MRIKTFQYGILLEDRTLNSDKETIKVKNAFLMEEMDNFEF